MCRHALFADTPVGGIAFDAKIFGYFIDGEPPLTKMNAMVLMKIGSFVKPLGKNRARFIMDGHIIPFCYFFRLLLL